MKISIIRKLFCAVNIITMDLSVIHQALIGDRYGYRPFPAKIPLKEFQLFVKLGVTHNINTKMLREWYKLDHNAVSKIYQLIPITSYYPNYSSKNHKLRNNDREGWWKTFLELQKMLWDLVLLAVNVGKMTSERAHIYLQSGEHYRV